MIVAQSFLKMHDTVVTSTSWYGGGDEVVLFELQSVPSRWGSMAIWHNSDPKSPKRLHCAVYTLKVSPEFCMSKQVTLLLTGGL